jgi:hypothetical protein
MSAVVGAITRGTTAPRRLRRIDRWLVECAPAALAGPAPLVVDLGFGATPITTIELARRLRSVNPTVRVVGLDTDAERVRKAAAHGDHGIRFEVGGFELAGYRPTVVRAFNVLRQYDVEEVPAAWATMGAALAPGGRIVEGTCDELGRLGAWVTLDASGAVSLTLAVDLRRPPEDVAARLPKALITHNVPGQPIHALLQELSAAWRAAAALSVFSPRQRFVAAAARIGSSGWRLLDGPARWRRGELTVAWSAVRPR